MIATCAECGKRYRLPDEAVPPEGRSVRCSACGHSWITHRDAALPFEPAPPFDSAAHLPLGEAPPRATIRPTADAASLVEAARLPPVSGPSYEDRGHDPAPSSETETTSLYRAPARSSRPRRRRWPWVVVLLALLAVGAAAVIEFAPVDTFDPPRLGLPPLTLPVTGPGAISLPKLTVPKLTLPKLHIAPLSLPRLALPPLDLTRIPYAGVALDRLVNPPPVPASPLRLTVSGERRRLASGHTLLTVTGSLANPTNVMQPVPAIDAALLDPAGHVAFRWRIAPPVVVLAPHQLVAIDSVAANYPPGATVLRLRFRGR